MVRSRPELQEFLEEFCDNVYYQPPAGMYMNYPAIVYKRSDIRNTHADNLPYRQGHLFDVTVIDEDPDSEIVAQISKLPRCRYDRHFTFEEMNHDVFTIYY